MSLPRHSLVAALSLLTGCASLATRAPLEVDRPDYTDGPSIMPAGRAQLETGVTRTRDDGTQSTALGEVFVRVGLGGRSELRVVGNSHLWERAGGTRTAGMQDVALGVKVAVSPPAEAGQLRPDMAILAGTTIPTGSSAYRSTHLQPELKFITAWTLTERVSLSGNLVASYPVIDDRSRLTGAVSASLGVGLTERVDFYAEAYSLAPHGTWRGMQHFTDGGLLMLLSPDVQLDVRMGTDLRNARRNVFGGVGIAVRR